MPVLAINGGVPVRNTPFPSYVTIGEEEKRAVIEVLDGKVLSQFLGSWGPDFLGGPRVRALEENWCSYFDVDYAISVNSATSGLYAATGAAGVGPGDEVIVSPFTMTASAAAAVVYGAIPVFADICPDTFCLDPESIKKKISPYTKAIIVVDIFGHPAAMNEIMALAAEHNLIVIEDAAQAPGAVYHGRYAGTLAHMGVFSLNYHKTIHCGEGGVVVTNDENLAKRLQLIRNHGEVVVKKMGVKDITNLVGFNYRMTEIEAAIANEQLKKLSGLVKARDDAARFLTEQLAGVPGIQLPVVRPEVSHGWYLYVMKYDETVFNVPRSVFVSAVKAEGVPLMEAYVEPIYLEPMYQERIAFGKDGFPFTYSGYKGQVDYSLGICPVTERMHYNELIFTNICHANCSRKDLQDFVMAIKKVTDNCSELTA